MDGWMDMDGFVRRLNERCEHYGPLHVQQERPQMRVVFKSYSRPTLQATKHGFFYCPTKPSTQARSTLEWQSCRSLPGGHASVIHAARLYRWQITLLLSSPFSHSNLLLPRQIHIPLYIIHNFQGLVFFPVLVRFPSQSGVLRTKNGGKSWQVRVLVQKSFIHTSVWNVSTLHVCGT